MLTYRFFNVIFDFAFVLLMLINLMIGFNAGNFANVPNNSYFGITTLISIFEIDNAPQGTPSYLIGTFVRFIQGQQDYVSSIMLEEFSKSMDYIMRPSFWYEPILGVLTSFGNIGSIIAYVLLYVVMILAYVCFVLSMFAYILTGGVISTQPTNIWTYPAPQFHALGSTLINYI